MDKEKREFMEIDIGSLSETLATEWFENRNKDIPEEKLYDFITRGEYLATDRDGDLIHLPIIQMEIKEHLASEYWLLVDKYRELIKSFSKSPELIPEFHERCINCGARLEQYERERGRCYHCYIE